MKLQAFENDYSIVRYRAGSVLPPWVTNLNGFFSITQTDEELSVVCQTSSIEGACDKREDGWKRIKVLGPLDFGLTGILSSIASPLADAKISIFALSTYDTDYLLVKADMFEDAKKVLIKNGFSFLD